MAKMTVHRTELLVEVEGLDNLRAPRDRLTVPLAHVRGATSDASVVAEPKETKVGGSRIPASSPPGGSCGTVARCSGTSVIPAVRW